MARMKSARPSQKVVAGALAGAITTIIVYAAKTYTSAQVPGEVAAAVTTVLTFVASYVIPPAENDLVEAEDEGASVPG